MSGARDNYEMCSEVFSATPDEHLLEKGVLGHGAMAGTAA
jgi:hypothetical protein